VCDHARGPGLARRWTGAAATTVTGTSGSAHSSTAFAKQSSEEDHVGGVLPTSSSADRRVVVEWGPNEKSQLYVTHIPVVHVWGCC
jgi:hypothetical protein